MCGPANVTADPRRVFFGVALPDETRSLLGGVLSSVMAEGIPGRATPPANWHLTLRFVGRASAVERERMLHTLSEASLPGPFRVTLGSLGAFPHRRRATVLWVGASGSSALGELAAACEEAAVSAGFAPEDRPFHAHVTLARMRPPHDVAELVARAEQFRVPLRVGTVTLFQSHLGPGGARYEAIDGIDL